VSEVNITARCFPAPAPLRDQGVRCFARVVIENTISVDGLTVRTVQGGGPIVTWPERKDSTGRHHAIVRILDEDTREAVERAVLDAAVSGGWLDPGWMPKRSAP
jgi:DNA-binding cell septation regulator SpoVG